MYDNYERSTIADMLYGNYIKYDRLYEMSMYALYGKTNSSSINIFIDAYSLLRKLYSKGINIHVEDSSVIASCLINLAIHLRAYFETRHGVSSKVYIIYGGARPSEALSRFPFYNGVNILMEDSNDYILKLVMDNLEIMDILCPYLHDIFSIVDYENEFSVIVSTLIDSNENKAEPNIVYSKDPLSYQLVAFKPWTFLYRPKKRRSNGGFVEDTSWVVTKSTLYNAYRNGELKLSTVIDSKIDVQMFSIYQTISGVKSRNIKSIKNANVTLKLLSDAVDKGIFFNGYNASALERSNPNPFYLLFENTKIDIELVMNRFAAIDLPYQTLLFKSNSKNMDIYKDIINLYNPDEIRSINNKYFQKYPLDLNRV